MPVPGLVAAFREATGTDGETVETAAANPRELFEECRSRHDSLEHYSATMVAVNDEMSDWEAPLAENDEVLFFPPVAGG